MTTINEYLIRAKKERRRGKDVNPLGKHPQGKSQGDVIFEVTEARSRGNIWTSHGKRHFVIVKERTIECLRVGIRETFQFNDNTNLTILKTLKGPIVSTDLLLSVCKNLIYVYSESISFPVSFPVVDIDETSEPATRPCSTFTSGTKRSIVPTLSTVTKKRSILPTLASTAAMKLQVFQNQLDPVAESKLKAITPSQVLRIGVEGHTANQDDILLSQFGDLGTKPTWKRLGFVATGAIKFDEGFREVGTFKVVHAFEIETPILTGKFVLKHLKAAENIRNCIENVCKSNYDQMTQRTVKIAALCNHWVGRFNQSFPPDTVLQLTLGAIECCLGQSFQTPTPEFAKGITFPIIIERFFGGKITKTINNDGEIIYPGTPESDLTEAFVHFVWLDSGKTAMPLDVQFFREKNNLFITDTEVATYGNSTSWEFCAGNLGVNAINKFLIKHVCNDICTVLALGL